MVQPAGTIAAVPAFVAVRPKFVFAPGVRAVAQEGAPTTRVPASDGCCTADQMLTSVCGKVKRTCHGESVVVEPLATSTEAWNPVAQVLVEVQVTSTRSEAALAAVEATAPPTTRAAVRMAAARAERRRRGESAARESVARESVRGKSITGEPPLGTAGAVPADYRRLHADGQWRPPRRGGE